MIVARHRIIPASAGNGPDGGPSSTHVADHPRVCGERFRIKIQFPSYTGSSPRLRGTAMAWWTSQPWPRIIPASAGNGLAVNWMAVHGMDHPRVCGERQPSRDPLRKTSGSSPRLRGTVVNGYFIVNTERIIPASAGNGFALFFSDSDLTDHPRVCGERH